MSLDIPNAFIQAHVPKSKNGEQIVMKIRGILVDWLIELDPTSYSQYVVYENGKKVLYVEVVLLSERIYNALIELTI